MTVQNLIADKHGNYILPFFWQHGEDEATLRDYMRAIQGANIGAVCVESRPHPDFCGEKWWADMDVILDEARKRSMQVWILDDSHFPTGFANGAMAEAPLSLARRSVCCQKTTAKAGEALYFSPAELQHPAERQLGEVEGLIARMFGKGTELPPQSAFPDDALVAVSALFADGSSADLSAFIAPDGSLSYTMPADGIVYRVNHTRNRGAHPNYINMTDRASCRVLIDAVYEKHYAHYAADFGTTIAGFFSDEPELGNGHLYELHHELGIGFEMDYPWGTEAEEALRAALGKDFATALPLLWETGGDEEKRAKARYTYMDTLTRLVEKNFSRQLGDWCRAHGVQYIGHIIEDNGQHCRTGSTLGHYFRALAGQDMAGIDDIGGQVYPLGEDDNYANGVFQVRNGTFYHFMLGKLASSLAAVDATKHGNAMCEIFGNYGWEEGLRLEKYLADHFIVRGVNRYVPHAFSAAPFPDPDCPPHFYAHGHNPEYKAFGELMTYMNRSVELISGGRHIAPVALIYPGEGEWTGKSMPGEQPARVLTEQQVEFDFVPMDAFSDTAYYNTSFEPGALRVNTQCYRAVVVPYMQFIGAAFASAVAKLTASGVRVIFTDALPDGIYDGSSAGMASVRTAEVCPLAALAEATAPFAEIRFSPADRYLRYYHYVKPDGTGIYMLVNEGSTVYEGTLRFPVTIPVFSYDAWNNRVHTVCAEDGILQLRLVPGKSRFLIVPATAQDAAALTAAAVPEFILPAGAEKTSLCGGWVRSTVKSIAYPAFENPVPVTLPDTLAAEQPNFSGWVKYENTLTCEAGKRYALEITDAFETVELYVNGVRTGLQLFAPYVFDLTGLVKPGENTLRIEVATTLQREMLTVPDRFGRPKAEPKEGTGITGEVSLYTF